MTSDASDGSIVPVRFRIHGRVQGVGFRWWTRAQATDLGITGTVRNDADGSVEIEAFGSEAALARFRTVLAKGPPSADVDWIEESPIEDKAPPRTFEIGG